MNKTPISYPVYPFCLPEGNKLKIHNYRVRPDGTVGGHEFHTQYRLMEKAIDYGDFIGFVVCDGHDGFIETRIPVAALEEILKKGKTNE